jgi:hypothetical protein
LSGPRAALAAPFALNLNGNAITLSSELWAALSAMGPLGDVDAVAAAFADVARLRARTGRRLTLATVFPFSSHTYQLRLFAARGGLVLDDVATIVVVPPPHMVDALRRSTIAGFCVGASWDAVAVAERLSRFAAFGSDLAPDCPEKDLAVPASRRDVEEGHRTDLATLWRSRDILRSNPRSFSGRSKAGCASASVDRNASTRAISCSAGGHTVRSYRRLPGSGTAWPAVYRPDLYDAAFR